MGIAMRASGASVSPLSGWGGDVPRVGKSLSPVVWPPDEEAFGRDRGTKVSLSAEAQARLGGTSPSASSSQSAPEVTPVEVVGDTAVSPGTNGGDVAAPAGHSSRETEDAPAAAPLAERGRNGKALSSSELQVLDNLRARDTVVRAHEAAHQSAAGGLGGAVHFDYQMGPDGKSYAVGGDVPVQLGGGRTPSDRLANANRVVRAALAPADPSAQDRAVAAEASTLALEAQREMVTQSLDKERSAGAPPADAKADAKAQPATEPTSTGHTRAGDGCASCAQMARRYAASASSVGASG